MRRKIRKDTQPRRSIKIVIKSCIPNFLSLLIVSMLLSSLPLSSEGPALKYDNPDTSFLGIPGLGGRAPGNKSKFFLENTPFIHDGSPNKQALTNLVIL